MLDKKSAVNRFLESQARAWLGTEASDTASTTSSAAHQPTVHIRVQGRSQDLSMPSLGLTQHSSPLQVQQALASYLDLSQRQINALMLDRSPNGNWILRPAAVFG